MNRSQALAVARKAAHAHAARLAADAAAATSDAIRERARAALASPVSPVSQRAALLASIRHAITRMDARIIRIYATEFAAFAGFSEIPKTVSNNSENPKNASFELAYAAGRFFAHQSPDSLAALVDAAFAYERALLTAHDTRPPTIISPDVPGFEPQHPPIKRTPVGALDWQTHPPIGTNPADLCEFRKPRKPRKPAPTRIVPKRERIKPRKATLSRPLAGIATLTLPKRK